MKDANARRDGTARRWLTAPPGMKMLALAIAFLFLLLPDGLQAQDYPLTVLHTFMGCEDGANPNPGLIADPEGNLYGTTAGGGLECGSGLGVVFKIDPQGNETVLHAFTGNPDGDSPYGGVIRDAEGNLYGTTEFGGKGHGTVYKVDPQGNETVLYEFTAQADGTQPFGSLVMDAAGNLFGIAGCVDQPQCYSVVFKVDPTGNESVLYTFKDGKDGEGGPFTLGSDGNFYGISGNGTTAGEVYKLDLAGFLTPLHYFSGGSDGAFPTGVIRDASGNLYGSAEYGGEFFGLDRYGVVFKLDPAGNETVLYTFTQFANDQSPYSVLTPGPSGNFYGVANGGNILRPCMVGCGVLYKVAADGSGQSAIYSFTGLADGAVPNGGLVIRQGFLYGTTFAGGYHENPCAFYSGCGVLFKLRLK